MIISTGASQMMQWHTKNWGSKPDPRVQLQFWQFVSDWSAAVPTHPMVAPCVCTLYTKYRSRERKKFQNSYQISEDCLLSHLKRLKDSLSVHIWIDWWFVVGRSIARPIFRLSMGWSMVAASSCMLPHVHWCSCVQSGANKINYPTLPVSTNIRQCQGRLTL